MMFSVYETILIRLVPRLVGPGDWQHARSDFPRAQYEERN